MARPASAVSQASVLSFLWATAVFWAIAILPLANGRPSSARVVSNATDFISALLEPSVSRILITTDIAVHRLHNAAPRIRRSVVLGGLSADWRTYPTLDFSSAGRDQVALASGVTLTLRRLTVVDAFSLSSLEFDFFAQSEPGSTIVWEQVVDRRSLCPPLEVLRAAWLAAPRPAAVANADGGQSPPEQRLERQLHDEEVKQQQQQPQPQQQQHEEQQQRQLLQLVDEALCGKGSGRHPSPAICGEDVLVERPAGYRIRFNGTLTICDGILPQACVEQPEPELCRTGQLEGSPPWRRARLRQASTGVGGGRGGGGGGAEPGVVAVCIPLGVLLTLLAAVVLLCVRGRGTKSHNGPTRGSVYAPAPSPGAAADVESSGAVGAPPAPGALPTPGVGSLLVGATATAPTRGSPAAVRVGCCSTVFCFGKAQVRRQAQLADAGMAPSLAPSVHSGGGGGGGGVGGSGGSAVGPGATPPPPPPPAASHATGTGTGMNSICSAMDSNGGGTRMSPPSYDSSNPTYSSVQQHQHQHRGSPTPAGSGVGSAIMALLRAVIGRASNHSDACSRQEDGSAGGGGGGQASLVPGGGPTSLLAAASSPLTKDSRSGAGRAAAAGATPPRPASGQRQHLGPQAQTSSGGLSSGGAAGRPSLSEIQQELDRLETQLMRDPRTARQLRSQRSRDLSGGAREGRREGQRQASGSTPYVAEKQEQQQQPAPRVPSRGPSRGAAGGALEGAAR